MPFTPSSRVWRYGLLAIVATFILITLTESLTIPSFEGPDEQRHYAYARYLANNLSLPPRYKTGWNEMDYTTYEVAQESGQPPLYYIPLAILTSLVPHADDVDALVVRNWFVRYNGTLLLPNDNVNKYIHGPEEQFPYQGATLAVHLGRLLSILIGTCTLLAVYHMGRVLAPSRPIVALLAAGLVASVPGYTFIHSFMTNDTLVILFTTLSMSVALRIVREGPTRQLALLGGLFSGLTALSKLNGIWVAGIVWLAILLYALAHRKQKPLRSIFPPLMLSMGLWLALTGGWFAYGLSHGGDPLGIAIHASYTWQNPLRLMVPPPGQWLADLWEWDHYIWGNSTTWPEWIYAIFRGLYVIGLLLAGISALRAWKHRTAHSTSFQQGSFLSLAIALAWLGGLYWLFIYNWRFGRLLYPGLTSAAVLAAAGLAWGFHQLQALNLPRRIYSGAAAAILIGVLAASINGALNAIDTYRPDRVSPQALAGMQQTLLTFVDPADGTTPVATVTGYAIPNQDVRAGGVLTATICWKSDGYRRASFPYALQLVGPRTYNPERAIPITAWGTIHSPPGNRERSFAIPLHCP